jgi:hypothetical protein
VLYAVADAASILNSNILYILRQCEQQHNATTPWTSSGCPTIYLNDTQVTLFLRAGDAQAVPSAPTWAWSNILQAGEVMKNWSWAVGFADHVLGFMCVRIMYAVLFCIAPIFLIVHNWVLKRRSAVYRGLTQAQQLVCCQHAVYAVVLSLQLVPQSYLAIRFLFKAWTGNYVAGPEVTLLLGAFLMTHGALYMMEASVRSIRFSWLLLAHHQLFFTIIIMGVWTSNVAVLCIGIILDWFVAHECFLYVVLVMYRLQAPRRLTLGALYWACGWYIATRIVQTVLLLYPIISWAFIPAVATTPAFIITAVFCGAFTVIQAYTLVIYKAIGIKLLRQESASSSTAAAAGGAGEGLHAKEKVVAGGAGHVKDTVLVCDGEGGSQTADEAV